MGDQAKSTFQLQSANTWSEKFAITGKDATTGSVAPPNFCKQAVTRLRKLKSPLTELLQLPKANSFTYVFPLADLSATSLGLVVVFRPLQARRSPVNPLDQWFYREEITYHGQLTLKLGTFRY